MRISWYSKRFPQFFLIYAVIGSGGTQISQMTQILTCSLGISQISGDFADDLQNSCFILGGFEEKAYFCGKVERLKGEDYEYGCFK